MVYMAEQTEPVTRKVALKIIKLGMDTKQVVARFEAERQALAMMDHQNIAKVLDAGETDTGRPYFVKKLVRGVPITEYCDKNKLSTTQRLELFISVCHAIQHAHQKGVIHRDIKPSNVMVSLNPDGTGHPMVIDFGVAKATNQRLTERTLFTDYAHMIGTPAYMSAEQAEMSRLDIDTRTDVCSLGVLLYELLTGTTPFPAKELRSMAYGEMRRLIAEKEPAKPRTRYSTMTAEERTVVARNRKMEVSAVGRVFRSDLDWIAMRCLKEDRSRRYDTVNGLAMDIRRHLLNELVAARPPSTWYTFQKAWRRNKIAYSSGMAVAAALVLGITFSTFYAIRARRAESDANIDRNRAVAANDQAKESERRARLRAYVSNLAIADAELKSGRMRATRHLLEEAIPPNPDEEDFRDFGWRLLWSRLEQSGALMNKNQGWTIISVSYSPDGSRIATGGISGWITVMGDRLLNETSRWRAHPSACTAVAFSKDGDLLATIGASEGHAESAWRGQEPVEVRLWDLKQRSPSLVTSFPAMAGGFNNRVYETQKVFFSPTQPVLMFESAEGWPEEPFGDVVFYDYQNRRFLEMRLPKAGPLIALSSDGSKLLTGISRLGVSDWPHAFDSAVFLGDLTAGRLLGTFEDTSDVACAWIDQEECLVYSKGANVWVRYPSKPELHRVIASGSSQVLSISIHPSEKALAIVQVNQVNLIETRSWRPLKTVPHPGTMVWGLRTVSLFDGTFSKVADGISFSFCMTRAVHFFE